MKFIEILDSMSGVSVVVRSGELGGEVALASLLYTIALQKHSQVFWLYDGDVGQFSKRFATIPWSANVKNVKNREDCLNISVSHLLKELSFVEIFYLLKNNDYKINAKMATALYAGLAFESDGFFNADSALFIVASELITLGANHFECMRSLIHTESLANLRARAIMLQNMRLVADGKIALFDVSLDDLLANGADNTIFARAASDALRLPTVNIALIRCSGIACKTLVYGQNSSNLAKIAKKFDTLVVGNNFAIEKIVEPTEIFTEIMQNEKK